VGLEAACRVPLWSAGAVGSKRSISEHSKDCCDVQENRRNWREDHRWLLKMVSRKHDETNNKVALMEFGLRLNETVRTVTSGLYEIIIRNMQCSYILMQKLDQKIK
jgi:hypothetical protein